MTLRCSVIALSRRCACQAARHRLEGGASVKATARAVGFASPEHLSRVFKRRLAMSPLEYRRAHIGDR